MQRSDRIIDTVGEEWGMEWGFWGFSSYYCRFAWHRPPLVNELNADLLKTRSCLGYSASFAVVILA